MNTLEQALDICYSLDPRTTGALGVAVDVYHTWWDPKLHELRYPEHILRAQ